MRNLTVFTTLALCLLCFLNCEKAEKSEIVKDIVKAAPKNAKLVFENNYVKVVEFYLKPGDRLPMHEGGKRLVYALTDYIIKWTEGDQVSTKEWTRRDIHWHDAIDHAVENIGETDAKFVVFSRKESDLASTEGYDVSKNAAECDSAHSKIIFRNDEVCVIEVNIPPGEQQPMHHGINRLIYSLDPYEIRYTSDKMGVKEAEFHSGDVHWHGADEHAVENIGDTPVAYLIIEFLK